MAEKHYRSMLKAVSWRITGTIDTILISWLITRKITMAMSIGGIEVVTKMTLYYIHERLWNRSRLGRVKEDDYQI